MNDTKMRTANEALFDAGQFDAGQFGLFLVKWTSKGLVSIAPQKKKKTINGSTKIPTWISKPLTKYFSGKEEGFRDVPLDLSGTDFQKNVWAALQKIPFGEVRTYKDIAVQVGRPKASRAIGMANHHNPVPVVVPCHRVIGSNGSLTGYAFGLSMKEKLLELEGVTIQQ